MPEKPTKLESPKKLIDEFRQGPISLALDDVVKKQQWYGEVYRDMKSISAYLTTIEDNTFEMEIDPDKKNAIQEAIGLYLQVENQDRDSQNQLSEANLDSSSLARAIHFGLDYLQQKVAFDYWRHEGVRERAALTALCLEDVSDSIYGNFDQIDIASMWGAQVLDEEKFQQIYQTMLKASHSSLTQWANQVKEDPRHPTRRYFDSLQKILNYGDDRNLLTNPEKKAVEISIHAGMHTAIKESLGVLSVIDTLGKTHNLSQEQLQQIALNSESLVKVLAAYHLNAEVPFFNYLKGGEINQTKVSYDTSKFQLNFEKMQLELTPEAHDYLMENVSQVKDLQQKPFSGLTDTTGCFAGYSQPDGVSVHWKYMVDRVGGVIFTRPSK